MAMEDTAVDSRPITGLGVDENAAVIYENGKLSIISAGQRKQWNWRGNLSRSLCRPSMRGSVTPITLGSEAMIVDEMAEHAM